jgi:hypothetical protein
MATNYVLLHERLNIATHEQETVIAHYTSDNRDFGPFEYIDAPLSEAVAQMAANGWMDLHTGGPSPVVMKEAAS